MLNQLREIKGQLKNNREESNRTNSQSLDKKNLPFETDPQLITKWLAQGKPVAIPKEQLKDIMKLLDYEKLTDYVIETIP